VDAGFINQMETKWENVHFTRVDSDITDNLINKQDIGETVLNKEEEARLRDLFRFDIPGLHLSVEVKGLSPGVPPVIATRPEFMRRMKDMSQMGGSMTSFYANMPDEVTLTVNGNHPIFQTVLAEGDQEKQGKLVHNLADLALLSQGLLQGAELTAFINRSVELIEGKQKGKIILES
jgi:molecular chaperone HtpG